MLLEILLLIISSSFWLEPGSCAPSSNPIRRYNYPNYRKDVENLGHEPDGILKFIGNSSEKETLLAVMDEDNKHKKQNVVFPDSKEEELKTIPQIDTEPECARESTFCEEIESYPYNRVKHILGLTNRHKELFGVDEGPIEHRIGDPEDTFICPSIDRIIFPKIAKNKYNKWKFIINQGEQDGYVQGIRIETCIKLNGPCSLLDSTPNGYVTSCKQKYIYRRLLSISDIGRPMPDTFHMPSACCCSYKRDPGYLINFGKEVSSA